MATSSLPKVCNAELLVKRILTVFFTDNPVAQKLLIKQLERYDLHVTATSNGEEALAGVFPYSHNLNTY